MTFCPIICIHINLWMITFFILRLASQWQRWMSKILFLSNDFLTDNLFMVVVQSFPFTSFHFIQFSFWFWFHWFTSYCYCCSMKMQNITMFKYPIYLQCDFPPYQFHNFPDAVNLMVSWHSLKQRMRMKNIKTK